MGRRDSTGSTYAASDGESSDELDPAEPAGERWPAERLLAEWKRCRSIRRLMIGLNEGGADLAVLVAAALDMLPPRGRGSRRNKKIRERVSKLETHYEAIMELVGELGEVRVVTAAFAIWPTPPPELKSVPGRLEGTARSSGPSIRLWPHRTVSGLGAEE